MNEEETVLIERLKARDSKAVAEMVAHYRPRVFADALHFLGNRQDAEEVTQDVMVIVWRKIDAFRGDSSLMTWLRTMVRNCSFNRYHFNRRRGAGRMSSLSASAEGCTQTMNDTLPAEGLSVPRVAELAEFNQETEAMIGRLSENEQNVIRLIQAGHTYADVAQMLCIELGTVKSRVARARGRLRDLLDARSRTICDIRPERVA